MPSPPDLRAAQRLFHDLIRAPEGVVPGARDLVAEGRLESEDLAFLIRGDDRLGASQRLDIYASMYFYRLRDALAEDFPKVVAALGGARFHNLITDYLIEHPSRTWSLRFAGEALPGFLARHAVAGEFPWLADLARLEWARIEVFDETDIEPIGRKRIASLDEAGIATLRLGLVPACRLLALDHTVAPVWLAIEQGGSTPAGGRNTEAAVAGEEFETIAPARVTLPSAQPCFLRAWRHGFTVYHRTMRADEHTCLVRLRDRGATLPEIGDQILEHLKGEVDAQTKDLQDHATQRMAGLFEIWLSEGLLVERAGATGPA